MTVIRKYSAEYATADSATSFLQRQFCADHLWCEAGLFVSAYISEFLYLLRIILSPFGSSYTVYFSRSLKIVFPPQFSSGFYLVFIFLVFLSVFCFGIGEIFTAPYLRPFF